MTNPYFYKGYRISDRMTHFIVSAPALKNKVIKVTRTIGEAKLWIETLETANDVRRAAREIDAILN